MKKIFTRPLLARILFIITASLEILLLLYFNIFHIRDIVDSDFAMQMRHAIEISVNRTFFPRGWHYLTMGHFDDANLPAAFFYTFTKNKYLSFGLAGIFNMALWAAVIYRLLRLTGLKIQYYFLALSLIFATYNFGMLEYTNMMFFGGGFYVYIPLIPVLFTLLVLGHTGKGAGRFIFYLTFAVYHFLLFLTAAARGLYVFVCGIFPILLCLTVCCFTGINKNRFRLWGVLSVSSVVVTAVGYYVNLLMDGVVEGYAIIKAGSFLEGCFSTITDYLRIFRALEEGMPGSLEVTAGLARFCIVIFISFFSLFFGLKKLFFMEEYFTVSSESNVPYHKASGEDEKTDMAQEISDRELVQSCLISVFAFTFLILTLTNTEPRYQLIAIVPLMLSSVIGFFEFRQRDKKTFLPEAVMALLFVMLLINLAYSLVYTRNEYFHLEDGEYRRMDDILGFMDKYEAGTAFVDISQAERLRNYDLTRVYETYEAESGLVKNREFYRTEQDRSAFSDKNIIITTKEQYEEYPYYIKDNYTLVGQISLDGNFEQGVWFCETNPIDGSSGLPVLSRSVDLPCSPDYRYFGDIDRNGYLTSGVYGNALISPEMYSDGRDKYNVILHYTIDNAAVAYMDFYLNDRLISSTSLPGIKDSVMVEIPELEGEYAFAVRKEDEKEITINKIEFIRDSL